MKANQTESVKNLLRAIREAKRPTFKQVAGECLIMSQPTLLVTLGVYSMQTRDGFPLWMLVVGWVLVAFMVSAQTLVVIHSVRARRALFELRDQIAKVNGQTTSESNVVNSQ